MLHRRTPIQSLLKKCCFQHKSCFNPPHTFNEHQPICTQHIHHSLFLNSACLSNRTQREDIFQYVYDVCMTRSLGDDVCIAMGGGLGWVKSNFYTFIFNIAADNNLSYSSICSCPLLLFSILILFLQTYIKTAFLSLTSHLNRKPQHNVGLQFSNLAL